MSTVYLFDVDGTLISSGGAARGALELAFERLHGSREACGFSFAGMTDRAIFRRGLVEIGVEPSAERIDALIALYLSLVDEFFAKADSFKVHPGVREVLDHLGTLDEVAIGLGTGNVEEGAFKKLRKVDLDGYFSFGGYGSDAEDRAELLRIGAQRGAAQLGRDLDQCRVVVIGDTRRDVHAAHAIGAECVAVTTGGNGRRTLEAAQADFIFRDLAQPCALEALVYGASAFHVAV